jgi:hypothetical protein
MVVIGFHPLSEIEVLLSCLMIFFKPMAGNDAIVALPFVRSSIAGTTSWEREVVDFRSYSLGPDYEGG